MSVPNPIATFPKDPVAVLDYAIDWSGFLGDDTIASVAWTLDPGINNTGTLFSSNLTIIFLSGGVAGTGYDVSCAIVTKGARTDKRTIRMNLVNR